MEKIEYKNVMTQAEYARMKKISRARVCQMVKEKKLSTVWIQGAKFIFVEKNNL
jgi:DNA-binding transcriptional regulator LsrR (DeoR family)